MPLDIKIKRQIESPLHTTLIVELGGSLDTATAQVNAYRHGTLIHDWVKAGVSIRPVLTFRSR